MKTLKIYLEELMATPAGTMGMGNPGCDANGNCTEPISGFKDKKKRSKKISKVK